MKVEVRPITREKWHGKKNKESFSRPIEVEVLYDPVTSAYATGLTPEEEEKYSKILGGARLDNIFNPEEPHPFWSSKAATIKLKNSTNLFNTDDPRDYIKVKNMKASKFVANSDEELKAGLWPDALFVIYDEQEEVAVKATKLEIKDKCVLKLQNMTEEDKMNVIQVLAKKTVKGKSPNFIRVEIETLIDENPDEFLRMVSMGRPEIYLRAMILEALNKRILTKDGTALFYMGEMIGATYEDAVDNMRNPNQNKVKVAIMEKLTGVK